MDKWLSIKIIIVMIFVSSSSWKRWCWDGNVTWYASQREQFTHVLATVQSCATKTSQLYSCLWQKRCIRKSFSTWQLLPFFSLLPRFSKRISYARTLKQEHLQTQYSIRNQIGYCLDMMCKLLCRQILSFKMPCVELSKSHTSQLPTQDNITIIMYLLFKWRGT